MNAASKDVCDGGKSNFLREATGTITSAGAWEPYGRPRAAGPNNPNAPPLGWAGQYQDSTGLTHLRARQYDPAAGIFLSPDPAGSTGISGTYSYGSANPLRYLDITGLFSWDEFLVGVQDVSGIVSDVAGVLAIAAAVTGVGAPLAAALGGISLAAGAVHAGTKAIQAYNTCNGGKGSCGDAVADALLSTAALVPVGGKLIKGAATGAKALASKVVTGGGVARTIEVDSARFGAAASHMRETCGSSFCVTYDPAGAAARRTANLHGSGLPPKPGYDRDEAPMAVFKESVGASVQYVESGPNRSLGAYIGWQLRGLDPGDLVRINVR